MDSMGENRMAFIQHITESLGRRSLPYAPSELELPNSIQHEYLRGASTDKLREIFIWNARAAGTTVYECELPALNETIIEVLAKMGAGPILLSDDPLWQEQQTIPALQQVNDNVRIWDSSQSREDNIDFAEAAAVGIAVAELALAETGTVMVYSEKGCGRSVTLLPEMTILIIRKDDIRQRLTQAMEYLRKQSTDRLPASINFISAASSTADIELVRVKGVHGPIEIAYIVVG